MFGFDEIFNDFSCNYLHEIINLRRHLHQNPELSFKEKETSSFIFDYLKNCGLQPLTYSDCYAVTCFLDNNCDKTIAFRADIDALPIKEATNLPYSSKNDGVMHACGHDCHTAIMLGLAKFAALNKVNLKHNLLFIFQHAEEINPGGAKLLVDNGLLNDENISAVIGLHLSPELPVGTIGLHSGPFMASSDEVRAVVIGKGGHAAKPKEVVNPIIPAMKFIEQCSNLTDIDADCPKLVAFGRFIAAGTTNVIPDEVNIAGTVRIFDEKDRTMLHEIMEKIAKNIEQDFKVQVSLNIDKGYPVLVNDADMVNVVRNIASEAIGKENVINVPIRTTSDDFAYYSRVKSVCYFRLGCGDGDLSQKVHSATFSPDEGCISTALKVLSYLILK